MLRDGSELWRQNSITSRVEPRFKSEAQFTPTVCPAVGILDTGLTAMSASLEGWIPEYPTEHTITEHEIRHVSATKLSLPHVNRQLRFEGAGGEKKKEKKKKKLAREPASRIPYNTRTLSNQQGGTTA